jgi:hypothetical protein
MNIPGPSYLHRFLRCHNSCAVPLPHPKQTKAQENRIAVFACPHCGLASAYSAQDIVEHLFRMPSLLQLRECRLVSIEIECDGTNCEAQKKIRTIDGYVEGTWRPKVDARDWTFSETACCGAGHGLRFDHGRGV